MDIRTLPHRMVTIMVAGSPLLLGTETLRCISEPTYTACPLALFASGFRRLPLRRGARGGVLSHGTRLSPVTARHGRHRDESPVRHALRPESPHSMPAHPLPVSAGYLHAWTAFQNAHWPVLGQVLPRLLTAAQLAVAAYPDADDQARRARAMLSKTYQVTASTLWKLKEVDLAWLAAERGLVLAEETGDSLLISDAARRVVQGLTVMGHDDQALDLVRADIDRLEPVRGSGSSAYLSLYGMLFLMGAVVAARASRQATTRDLLEEGHRVARQLGYDGNECFTAFGPTNVHLHQVAVLLDLGDGAGAVHAARQVTPEGLNRLPKERRANYYLDVARGHSLAGHRDEAISTLLTAESLFPDEIRCRPIAIDLLDTLRRSASGTHAQELEQLSVRAGLTNHG